MGNLGSECSISDIVSELGGCRAAATQLGKKYAGRFNFNSHQRPAGCYYWSSDNYVYFNSASLSDTQKIFHKAGGVCKRVVSIVHTLGKFFRKLGYTKFLKVFHDLSLFIIII